jgi:hypothetical protein
MAGRMGDFVYETDYGRLYAVLLDRSNALISALSLELYGDQVDPLLPNEYLTRQPTGLRLRKVVVQNKETGNVRELVCGTVQATAWRGQTKTIDLIDYNTLEEVPYQVLYRVSERQFRPVRVDL